MPDKEVIAGIDLGTTNSAIAVVENGVPRLIEIDGAKTMPSCVGFGDSGEVLVGRPALNQLAAAPERTVASIKRQMGSDLPVKLGNREFRPEEISAFILKRLKEEAERDLGRPLTKAVVTVPAYFDEKQRRATQDAAKLAGLDAVRILNEPTAASLAYNLQDRGGQTILVYDLGGGTFDVSLVVCESGLVEVKASHGDTQLGGDDFDIALTEHLAAAWTGKAPLDLNDLRVRIRLKMAAEAAKCRLSDHAFTKVREEYLGGDSHLEVELSRVDLEETIAPMLEKTWESIGAVLRDGNVRARDIDKILLVGGSTRIPLVHHLIEHRLGLAPSAELNPDLVVAMGAAIQGAITAGESVGSILVDITTHTFSTAAIDTESFGVRMICVPVIPRGAPLPVTRSEAFETVHDNQKGCDIEVYQGESTVPEENLRIGKFTIEGLSATPAGNILVSQFSLDLNGMLEVTATEKATGLARAVTIDTRDVAASFDLAEARLRLADAFGTGVEEDGAEPAEHGASNLELTRAKDLKNRAEKLMRGELSEEDRADLDRLLAQSRAAVKARDFDILKEHSDQLDDIIFYLEE